MLLIENNPRDLRLLQEMLREMPGFHLETASNLSNGIELLRSQFRNITERKEIENVIA